MSRWTSNYFRCLHRHPQVTLVSIELAQAWRHQHMRMSMFCQAGTGIVQHATADSSFCIGCSRAPFHARVSPFAAQRTSGKRRVWAAVNGLGPMAPQRADSSKQSIDSGSLSGFFERIADCNAGGDEIAALVPFDIGGITCGYLRPAFAEQLASLRHFQVSE